jgi:hypothetical protein
MDNDDGDEFFDADGIYRIWLKSKRKIIWRF